MPTEYDHYTPAHEATRKVEAATLALCNHADTWLWRHHPAPLFLAYLPTVRDGAAPYDGTVYLYTDGDRTGAGELVANLPELVKVGRVPTGDKAQRAAWFRRVMAVATVLPVDLSNPIQLSVTHV